MIVCKPWLGLKLSAIFESERNTFTEIKRCIAFEDAERPQKIMTGLGISWF